MGFKVCRNIGNAFVNIGKYCDTIQNYKATISSSPYHEICVNALLCYVALGDSEKSKRCFTKIMSLLLNQVGEEEESLTSERNNCKGGERCGELIEDELLCQSKDYEQVVTTASLIVDSVFGEGKCTEEYHWVHSQIKGTHESLSNRIKIEQALKHLESK